MKIALSIRRDLHATPGCGASHGLKVGGGPRGEPRIRELVVVNGIRRSISGGREESGTGHLALGWVLERPFAWLNIPHHDVGVTAPAFRSPHTQSSPPRYPLNESDRKALQGRRRVSRDT